MNTSATAPAPSDPLPPAPGYIGADELAYMRRQLAHVAEQAAAAATSHGAALNRLADDTTPRTAGDCERRRELGDAGATALTTAALLRKRAAQPADTRLQHALVAAGVASQAALAIADLATVRGGKPVVADLAEQCGLAAALAGLAAAESFASALRDRLLAPAAPAPAGKGAPDAR
jgi:hypothetical protein